MHFNGIESGHNADMHQITTCMHEEHARRQKTGAAAKLSAPEGNTRTAQAAQQEEGFSLSAWLERTFGSGKRLFRFIWGSSETAVSGEAGDKSAAVSAPVQKDVSQVLHTSQIAAASAAVTPSQSLQNNPYFLTVQDMDRQQETLWRKIRVKFKDVAGQLAGHLPGKFFSSQAKGSFQAKQGRSREDLRRYSKFRKDEVEIDCMITDDSYLLDSYDRRGEYSKLSTKK